MGAGVLLFDAKKRLLIVKPSYKTGWIIPGGVVEKDESPMSACRREVKEEIGINPAGLKLIGLDYIAAAKGQDENLQFTFSGGVLSAAQIRRIKLQAQELRAFRFAPAALALRLLRKKLARRLPYCLLAMKKNSCVYLENGSPRIYA